MALRKHRDFYALVLASVDSCWVLVAYMIAIAFTLPSNGPEAFRESFMDHALYLAVFIVAWFGAGVDQRLFTFGRDDRMIPQALAVAKAVAVSLVFCALVVIFFGRRDMDRDFAAFFGIGTLILILAFRAALTLVMRAMRKRGFSHRHIVVIGANERARRLVEGIWHHEHYGYRVEGILDDDAERMEVFGDLPLKYMGPCERLEALLTDEVVDEVYISLPVRSSYEKIHSIANLCEGIGVPVRMIADLFPLRIAKSHITHMEGMPLLSLSSAPEAHTRLLVKRLFDLASATAGLLLIGWWMFPLVALLVKLESRGPVFFGRVRVGLNGRRFTIYKFRSMVVDAEEKKEELAEMNEADGPVFKMRKDPRITRFGGILRKTSIDELPQLFNVWLGHMSLVGPRPPLPNEVAKYTWQQRRRLSVRPGVTGLQQVSGRSDVSFDDWVKMDLAYIDEWSLITDLRILLLTFRVVIFGKGAR